MARKKAGGKSKRWIQSAIKRPGRVRAYIKRKYGNKAFTKDGDIKQTYINKAIGDVKKKGDTSLLRALLLAKRLEKMRKGK